MINTFSGIKAIAETAELLLASRGEYQRTLNIIVESAIRISGADRSCLIIGNKKNELIIKAGMPLHSHGIEEKITRGTGEAFLRRIMKDDSMVLVTNPCDDPRVSYMKGLIDACRISSMLFLALRCEGEGIGVLVLDWTGGKKISRDVFENVRLLVRLASTAIGTEYKGRKDRERVLQGEKLRVLGEHSSQVAHIIRNSLLIIGGFSGRLLRYLDKEQDRSQSGLDKDLAETLRENLTVIDEESKKLERIVNDILTFTSIKKPVLAPHDINKFLTDQMSRLVLAGPAPILKLSKRLNGLNIAFDGDMLSICMSDLIRSAAEASASKVVIKTKLKPKQKEIMISLIHNGTCLHPHVLKDPFSPFVTSEINGSGLGLANVQTIVMKHGGDVSILSGDTTEFRITLPLIKCADQEIE